MFVITVHTNPKGPAGGEMKVRSRAEAIKIIRQAKSNEPHYVLNLWQQKKGKLHWLDQRTVKS